MKLIEVAVHVAAARAETAGELLLRFTPQGFAERSVGRRRSVLCAYLPDTAVGRSTLARLRKAFRAGVRHATVRTRLLPHTRWAALWKAHAQTIRIGRLTVRPSWKDPVRGSGRAAVVRLDPGMAFGSGDHPSTRLCLRAVDRYVRAGLTVIDVGTGSGILAIAAARLGAGRVLAIDNDPVAVEVARANVRTNGLSSRVTVRRGDGLARVHVRADVIVANLTADILPSILSDVAKRLARNGRLIASGFGRRRVSDVKRCASGAGLIITAVEGLAGWCAVHAAR